MSNVGQIERKTQNRVVELLRDQLGFEYLGNWEHRQGNSNIEVGLLEQNLRARGYDERLINRAVSHLQRAGALSAGRDLYEANQEVYSILRYGAKEKAGIGEQTESVYLIDWKNPSANHFAFAEEVSIQGVNKKRPDIVLYINGIAISTIELKRSLVNVSEGIRQTIGNQKKEFIRHFFSTVQYVFAGNDIEGLRYGVIDSPEKYWLEWKEEGFENANPLDRALLQMLDKTRFLELIHDFIVFDRGVKKGPRHNQYFGIKAAQKRIAEREGGIIWHTQGSGKSLTMVWLAKWIRENQKDARVLLITDRTELDEQIEKVFKGVSEVLYRTKSGIDLINTLNTSEQWLIGSLVHKFGVADKTKSGVEATEDYMAQLKANLPADFKAKGNIFVFVDEAHRTQSGTMHKAMKEILPDALFIGFTGTPLLKKDKATSIETFGSYIHTYKFNEAVNDGVVLDLSYEPRNIDQFITSPEKIDQWFDLKTNGMTDLSKAELKKRWGNIQKVSTSEPRARQIVNDILIDMETRPRLMDRTGNAMLVGSSIYQACKFYDLFEQTDLAGKCAIVTSYVPNASDISKEDSGEGKTEKIRQYDTYRRMLSRYFNEPEETAVLRVEEFEKKVKEQFIKEPGQMRLLIVVDKLLTGFDAPSATYLYIDKNMKDHGLFQAICRVNRLDGDSKDYGYIIDYRDLFNSLESAIDDYTSDALGGYDKEDVNGLLTNRIERGREDLDAALERIRALVEPVAPPKSSSEYQHYFVSVDPGNAEQIKANEQRRVELYKSVAAVSRAYANIANDMAEAGYSSADAEKIRKEISDFINIRTEVKIGAKENVDFKQYEAGMRHLLDNYIQADQSEIVTDFSGVSLVELLLKDREDAIKKLPPKMRKDKEAVAAAVANNVRSTIIDKHDINPAYYEKMSILLDSVLEDWRKGVIEYKEYLYRILEVGRQVEDRDDGTLPPSINTPAMRSLYDFGFDEAKVIELDRVVLTSKPHNWKGKPIKERVVRRALTQHLGDDFDRVDELLNLVKMQDEYQ